MALAGETNNISGAVGNAGQGPTIIAIAVPNTIRPPKLRKSSNPEVKALKKICVFLFGALVSFLSYMDASVDLFYADHDVHKFTFTIVAGFWFLAAIALFVGSILGGIKGEWRMLAPGMVLSHVAAFIRRLVL